MIYLLIASILWAPSFGLIKYNLAGLDSNFVAWARLFISFMIFVPFLRIRKASASLIWSLSLLGAVQYGLMYMTYLYSFRFLPAHLVALFTIFTPLYVTAIHDAMSRRFHKVFFLSALLAVAGAALIVYSNSAAATRKLTLGFLIVQASNLCFAFGQVYYRALMKDTGWKRERELFGLLYVGAVAASFIPAGLTTDGFAVSLSGQQIQTLLYLGIVPSGIAFFLWNVGAARTNAGTLAAFNNAKIPLAILCSLLFFAEHVQSLWRLAVGAVILLAAVIMNERKGR